MKTLWPEDHLPLPTTELATLRQQLEPDFANLLREQELPQELNPLLGSLFLPLTAWLASQCRKDRPLLVGINGSQGSGKSTICHLLQFLLQSGFNLSSCVISIDDLYLTHAERQQLSKDVHPLLATRGVPGTHDVTLGMEVFNRLLTANDASTTPIPRFDKACDDRFPEEKWDSFKGRPNLILFEGWCIGAAPQANEALTEPVNSLETYEDTEGLWRGYVNRQLSGPYRELFGRLDLLLMLKIPEWEMVYHWRRKQEQQLIESNPNGSKVMDDDALQRFIMHYERLTRHQLIEMPQWADLVLQLNKEQRIEKVSVK